MVRLDYDILDAQNQLQAQVWYQGFYSDRPSSDNNIQRCDNCPSVHEQISKDAWYLYVSGDLLRQLPANEMPVALNLITSNHLDTGTMLPLAKSKCGPGCLITTGA